jgi:hypothetical protein
MKQVSKRNLVRLGLGLIVTLGAVAGFSMNNSTSDNASGKIRFTDLAKVVDANADCQKTQLCSGNGQGCTIYIDGNPFTSLTCKSN